MQPLPDLRRSPGKVLAKTAVNFLSDIVQVYVSASQLYVKECARVPLISVMIHLLNILKKCLRVHSFIPLQTLQTPFKTAPISRDSK